MESYPVDIAYAISKDSDKEFDALNIIHNIFVHTREVLDNYYIALRYSSSNTSEQNEALDKLRSNDEIEKYGYSQLTSKYRKLLSEIGYTGWTKDLRQLPIYGAITASDKEKTKEEIVATVKRMLDIRQSLITWIPGKEEVLG